MEKMTTLHAAFVNFAGKIVREMSVPCALYRHIDIPYIEFDDNLINEILTPLIPEEGKLDFYDKTSDRFNFTCSNILHIEHGLYDVPDRIDIDILVYETFEDDEIIEHHMLLEPGIWKDDEYGTPCRVCDDSRYHFALDILVPKLILLDDTGKDSWKQNFFTAICELDMFLNSIFEEDDDDDDIDEFKCDDNCEECINKHCLDNPDYIIKQVHDEIDENDEKIFRQLYQRILSGKYTLAKNNNKDDEDVDEYDPDKYECIDDCENCSYPECVNHPQHNPKYVTNEWYSNRCAGHCDDCQRLFCITGERIALTRRSVNNTCDTKCGGCGHRKECEKAKAEFNVEKLYPPVMRVNYPDITLSNIINRLNYTTTKMNKSSSKRKHRKW